MVKLYGLYLSTWEKKAYISPFSSTKEWTKFGYLLNFEWKTSIRMVKLNDLYPNTRGRKRHMPTFSFFIQFWLWNKILEFFYCKRGLVWIGSKFLKDEEHSNGQAIRLVSKYSGKKEAYAKLAHFHPRRRQI